MDKHEDLKLICESCKSDSISWTIISDKPSKHKNKLIRIFGFLFLFIPLFIGIFIIAYFSEIKDSNFLKWLVFIFLGSFYLTFKLFNNRLRTQIIKCDYCENIESITVVEKSSINKKGFFHYFKKIFPVVSTVAFLIFLGVTNKKENIDDLPNIMVDSRDGQEYKTLEITLESGQKVTWMTENLNYKTTSSFSYRDDKNNPKEHGLFYMMDEIKSVCPEGWRLPTENDWLNLSNQYGGKYEIGKSLKSNHGWYEQKNGNNNSSLNALPVGFRKSSGKFQDLGFSAAFWTTLNSDSNVQFVLFLVYSNSGLNFSNVESKKEAFSCRCLKD